MKGKVKNLISVIEVLRMRLKSITYFTSKHATDGMYAINKLNSIYSSIMPSEHGLIVLTHLACHLVSQIRSKYLYRTTSPPNSPLSAVYFPVFDLYHYSRKLPSFLQKLVRLVAAGCSGFGYACEITLK